MLTFMYSECNIASFSGIIKWSLFLNCKRFEVDDIPGNDNTNYALNAIIEYTYSNWQFYMHMQITLKWKWNKSQRFHVNFKVELWTKIINPCESGNLFGFQNEKKCTKCRLVLDFKIIRKPNKRQVIKRTLSCSIKSCLFRFMSITLYVHRGLQRPIKWIRQVEDFKCNEEVNEGVNKKTPTNINSLK